MANKKVEALDNLDFTVDDTEQAEIPQIPVNNDSFT